MTLRRLVIGVAVIAGLALAAAGAGGESVAAPPGPADELTPELLERLRYGRAVHEEFAVGVGCGECHAREPRAVPRGLRGEFDPGVPQDPPR